jgi:hypothetical protein
VIGSSDQDGTYSNLSASGLKVRCISFRNQRYTAMSCGLETMVSIFAAEAVAVQEEGEAQTRSAMS